MSDSDYMLTTYDNSFNPFTEFDAWFKEDHRLGHNTCELLATIAAVSDVSSEELRERDTQLAMDTIASDHPMIYKKVKASDYSIQ